MFVVLSPVAALMSSLSCKAAVCKMLSNCSFCGSCNRPGALLTKVTLCSCKQNHREVCISQQTDVPSVPGSTCFQCLQKARCFLCVCVCFRQEYVAALVYHI